VVSPGVHVDLRLSLLILSPDMLVEAAEEDEKL
jgi:hypothetical protein